MKPPDQEMLRIGLAAKKIKAACTNYPSMDAGGQMGREVRNRQQTDVLKRHMEQCTKQRDALPKDDPRREHYTAKIAAYEQEKRHCCLLRSRRRLARQ